MGLLPEHKNLLLNLRQSLQQLVVHGLTLKDHLLARVTIEKWAEIVNSTHEMIKKLQPAVSYQNKNVTWKSTGRLKDVNPNAVCSMSDAVVLLEAINHGLTTSLSLMANRFLINPFLISQSGPLL